MEAEAAFERFRVWLKEREFNPDDCAKFMYMGKDRVESYLFKNINTRNYVMINIVPRPFWL